MQRFGVLLVGGVLLLLAGLAPRSSIAAARSTSSNTPRLNEFQAENNATVSDNDGDLVDWIELYNPGPAVASLAGLGLSDNASRPFKWVFPQVDLPPDGYLLVWASGKDRTDPAQPLHTNFSISSGGEPIVLTHPTLGTLDRLGPVPLPSDIAYGRAAADPTVLQFFSAPTPGMANAPVGYAEIMAPPVFSAPGGFYTQPFSLTLNSADPAATILYTLDGSLPDPANLGGTTYHYKNQYPRDPGDPVGSLLAGSYESFAYSAPLTVDDRSAAPNELSLISSTFDRTPFYFPRNPVFKGTVVRASTFKAGALPSPARTQTYFVTPLGLARYSLPVVALSVPEAILFDYEIGRYVAGIDFDTWRAAHPNTPVAAEIPANYHRDAFTYGPAYTALPHKAYLPFLAGGASGNPEWPIHVELFVPGSATAVIDQGAGLRLQGSATRSLPMKSLRLYARGEYGASWFNYPIFPGTSVDQFKRLILRNSGNDWGRTLLRDAAIQTIAAPLHVGIQQYQPALLFLNGEYWGIHNIRERYDKYYLEQHYGVDPDALDYLTDNQVVEEGDRRHYSETLAYIAAHGVRDPADFAYIETRIDTENFIDYQIVNIFARNTDWPGSNLEYWRLRTPGYDPQAPYGHDGRWRWLLKDTDFGFGLSGGATAYTHNTLAFATAAGGNDWPNPDWSTFLLRSLLENETFRQRFINRFADLLNTAFLPERAAEIITGMQQGIAAEVPEHIGRWNAPSSVAAWQNEVTGMLTFAAERPSYQRAHLREQFGLSGDVRLTVEVSHAAHGIVRLNTIALTAETAGVRPQPYPWTGHYFAGVPVELEALPNPGYTFVRWEGLPVGTPARTTQTFAIGQATVQAVFAGSSAMHQGAGGRPDGANAVQEPD